MTRTHTGNPYRNTEDSCPTPTIRKNLKKSKNYNQILGLLAAGRFMKSPAPSPANAATEPDVEGNPIAQRL